MHARSIVVTGMGCICAAGHDPRSVWHSLCHGVQNRTPAQHLHPDALPYAYFAVPEQYYPQGARTHTAKDTLHLARYAAEQALAQAQLPAAARATMGVIIGTTAGSAMHFLDGYAATRKPLHPEKPLPPPAIRTNPVAHTGIPEDIQDYFTANIALTLAQDWNSDGVSLTVANACTSGADAIGLGAGLIASGQCDVVVCGGADALSLVPHTGFARLMIYSPEAPRPFDADRQGLNLGEGAGILVLESAAHAAARKARVLGRIAAYAAAADAYHLTAPHPEARGLEQAVIHALASARTSGFAGNDAAGHGHSHGNAHGNDAFTLQSLVFINAHGTATRENDAVEGRFFARALPQVPVWGSKSITGHTLGAAGALEAIFSLLALGEGHIPPTWGFSTPQEDIGLVPTRSLTPCTGKYALSTSLAFGGGNAALILAKGEI